MKKNLGLIVSFLKKRRKLSIILAILVIGFVGWRVLGNKKAQVSYQTTTAEKGTLVVSVNESGQVAVANRTSITTQASGIINEVFAKNGDTITTGEKIATISLDQAGQQRQAQAYASYLSAKSALDSANAQYYSLGSTMLSKWNTYLNLAQNSTYQNADGTPNTVNRTSAQFMIAQNDWLAAEAGYKNQQNVISQDQVALNNAWLSYQSVSSDITAPSSGIISDLAIAPGLQINSSASSSSNSSSGNSSNTVSSQFIASIKNTGNPVITASLSEIDATKVKAGQKATVTFDALPQKSFTGKVVGVDTTGTVSSGVTTYPAIIQLDVPNDSILPNMSASADIIINVKNSVVLVPSSAVQTFGNQSTVRILKNGQVTGVEVEIGDSSDTQTEIVSGINAGDTVVTSYISTQTGTSTGSSPFSGNLRFGGSGFSGGGARVITR